MVSVLSVFWLHNGKVYGDEDIMEGDKVCTYGEYMQLNSDHFLIWDKYAKQMGVNPRYHDYDTVPRGRVLFHIPTHHFIIIGSSKIINSKENRQILLDYFGLPISTEFRGDEHYR